MKTLPYTLPFPGLEHGVLSWFALLILLLAGCADNPLEAPELAPLDVEAEVVVEALERMEGIDAAKLEHARGLRRGPGATTLLYPKDFPGPPYYANLSGTFLPHDGETAAITFIRQPTCIPEDFNLLAWLDFANAFGCDLTIRGVTFWFDPDADPYPFAELQHRMSRVPTWFVAWPELEAAIADGALTVGELESLPSLQRGLADRYGQVIFNSNQDVVPPGSQQSARGRLQDGRRFSFDVSERLINGVNVIQEIEIAIH